MDTDQEPAAEAAKRLGAPIVTVGMGATVHVGSDCYPATVVRVISRTRIVVQSDRGYPPDFERDPSARQREYSFRKDGRWREKGRPIPYCYLDLGERRLYLDPHF